MPPTHTPEDIAATFCATLIDEWIHHGVRHAVVAPGSRSTPIALALAARSDMRLHVFHDERAAAFAALGIGLSATPAILVCTSGTAAAHFHAAVIEAHLSAVPLLVCTADRPPELRDVGAPQTIDQTKLYGAAVRWFHDPGIADEAASASWRSLAAHAHAAATGASPGPVHLNLGFREPLTGNASELPPRSTTGPVTLAASPTADAGALHDIAAAFACARGVIVAGRRCGEPEAVRALALATGWPVLADARSGLRHLADVAISASDAMLRSQGFASANRPDAVIHLGEPPASKVLNRWLAGARVPQLHVTAVPGWTDPDGSLTHRLVAAPTEVCHALARLMSAAARQDNADNVEHADNADPRGDPSWLGGWLEAEATAQGAISEALSTNASLTEPLVARCVVAALGPGSHLVVSSSMPIRDVEWYGVVPAGVTVHANRGANGIDGVIATSIGVALSSGAPTTVLIGDIAFLHDASALIGLLRREIDVRIMVVDNDGGGIFSFLPQAGRLAADRFEQLFGTPHGVDLLAIAAAHSIPAQSVNTVEALMAALTVAGPSITIVRTDRAGNVAVHDGVHEAVAAALVKDG